MRIRVTKSEICARTQTFLGIFFDHHDRCEDLYAHVSWYYPPGVYPLVFDFDFYFYYRWPGDGERGKTNLR